MSEELHSLRETLRTRATGGIAAEVHPEIEELLAYLSDELDAAEEARIQDHLVACARCSATALELEPFTQPDVAEPEIGDLSRTAAWRELNALRMMEERGQQRAWRAASALAAILAAAVIGLSIWVGVLVQRPAPGASQANVPIHYLDELTRSRSGDVTMVELPSRDTFWVLVLTPPDGRRYPRYAVELVAADGSVQRLVDDLELTEHGTLRLGLAGDRIPPGRHGVRLLGIGDGGETVLDELPLEMRFG